MATHFWVRAESRDSEQRVGITPAGATQLIASGNRVTVEESQCRAIPISGYRDAGAEIAPEHSWPTAPRDAVVFGLKELPDDDSDLPHRHIMFGHAFKGQASGPALLQRFQRCGGALLDLEYLLNKEGRRVAAFGYWAGYAGAAVAVKTWVAQQAGDLPGPQSVGTYSSRQALVEELRGDVLAAQSNGATVPSVIVIGALGRVGTGASDLMTELGFRVTGWDMAETAHGGPFPEILQHNIFVNCILAAPGVPVFVPKSALDTGRTLSVVADISCDPDSDYNPIPIYTRATRFDDPVIRVHSGNPPLDVTAIDNLPSMLPVESSEDFAEQLLPFLQDFENDVNETWATALGLFKQHAETKE
jgi:saccharopine dehydrogenase (NAD+, L-lysine-forming)